MSSSGPAPVGRVIGRLNGLLKVTVHGARDLASKQMLGTMDPYIGARLKGEHVKSAVHKNGGRTPRWEHTFVFNLKDYDEHEILHFEVMNKELLSDDTIGLASVELKDLVTFHNVRRWYQLVHKHNFSHIAGAFEATIDYSGMGVEWFTQAQPVAAAPIQQTYTPAYSPPPAAAPAPAQPVYQQPAAAPAYAQQPAAPAAYAAQPYQPAGYPPQPTYAAQPAYAAPPAGYQQPIPYGQPHPQPYYGQPPVAQAQPYAQPYGQPAYYPPPAAAQPYYPPQQVAYGQQPTIIYSQPQPQVVEIIEPAYNPGALAVEAAILRAEEREIRREEREIRREEFFGGGGYY